MRLRQIGSTWIVHTPAKLNLFLEVLRKRPDGYHDLETVMTTVGLFDTLVFQQEPTTEVVLRCHDAGVARRQEHAGLLSSAADSPPSAGSLSSASSEVPAGPDNLVVRAAELLRSVTGCRKGIQIDLHKRIPTAAGLAGGSSDAAATLLALNRIWGLGLSREELLALASRIGSDVSFFLAGSSVAVCRGRGELIEPLPFVPRLHFVIARPGSGLSTPLVFKHCRPETEPRGASRLLTALEHGDLRGIGQSLFNSLQGPAEGLNRELLELKLNFERLPVISHMMSGSGTSWFGVCRHRTEAMRAAGRLRSVGVRRVYVASTPP